MSQEMEKDLFSEENKSSASNFWKPEKVGDRVFGYLIAIDERPNILQPGTTQKIYTLSQMDGTLINVAGRMKLKRANGQVVAKFPQLDNAKLGQLVGIEYSGDKEASKPGFNSTKLMNIYLKNDFRPDLVPDVTPAPPKDSMSEGAPF